MQPTENYFGIPLTQCDQMVGLYVQYLAIYNNKNLPQYLALKN